MKVLVCFDYEGAWGMPFRAQYDLAEGTHAILGTLARHQAHAVFFTVGAMALEHPELIREISAEGHEIALHGWRHERLDRLSPAELARVAGGLEDAEEMIESVTGRRPRGFRAPYLLGPSFFDRAIYDLLAAHDYQWTSNRELRHVVELLRPDRIATNRPWRLVSSRPEMLDGVPAQLLKLALNGKLVSSERVRGSIASRPGWIRSGCPPFYRGGLLEIPLYSPLDCDLIGLPRPSESTPKPLLDYALFALLSCLSGSGPLRMLTFHDWIISGGNRLSLLDGLLSSLKERDLVPVTVEDCWQELTHLADPGASCEPATVLDLTGADQLAASPRVSVVICSHNGEPTLPAALAHVNRQSLGADQFEVIVADDASTDRTAEVAVAAGARVLRLERNAGPAAARNAALAVARGAIVAVTDDDCEPAEDWLAALVSAFEDPVTDGAGGQVLAASLDAFVLRYLSARQPLAPLAADLLVSRGLARRLRLYLRRVWSASDDLLAGADLYSVPGANMAFRRELLVELGGFDEAFGFAGEDDDLCHRAHSRAGGASLRYEPLAVVRHRFTPSLRDTLSRARSYGKGNFLLAAKHPDMRLIIFPFPVAALATIIAATLTRRRSVALFAVLMPQLAYARWPLHAWRTRSLEPLAYPYIQLAEETATMLGELEASGAGYQPAPNREFRIEEPPAREPAGRR